MARAEEEQGWDWIEPERLEHLTTSRIHQPLLVAVLTSLKKRIEASGRFVDVSFDIIPMCHHGPNNFYAVIGFRMRSGDPTAIREQVEEYADHLLQECNVDDFLREASQAERPCQDVAAELFAQLHVHREH